MVWKRFPHHRPFVRESTGDVTFWGFFDVDLKTFLKNKNKKKLPSYRQFETPWRHGWHLIVISWQTLQFRDTALRRIRWSPRKPYWLTSCHVSTLLALDTYVSRWTGLSSVWMMIFNDDVIKGKHFPRYWSFVRGIHRSPVNSPHKGQWRGALVFSLIFVWINGWVSNCEADDLRRYRAHYDVSVMLVYWCQSISQIYHRWDWIELHWIEILSNTEVESGSKHNKFHSRKCIWKCRLQTGGHFVLAAIC